MLAPIAWRVPPVHYGPWELFASLLTEGLVARGHEVTLFASGDSVTSAALSSVVGRGWSEDPSIDAKVAECTHIAAVFERADDFDVIHNGFDFLPLTWSRLVNWGRDFFGVRDYLAREYQLDGQHPVKDSFHEESASLFPDWGPPRPGSG